MRGHITNDGMEIDYTHDVTDCPAFRHELKAIHERRDESCREWLQGHAFGAAKTLLAKMNLRIRRGAAAAGSTPCSSSITRHVTATERECAPWNA